MQNKAIRCVVKNCKFHDRSEYCTLNSIQVGQSAESTRAKKCCETECESFECES